MRITKLFANALLSATAIAAVAATPAEAHRSYKSHYHGQQSYAGNYDRGYNRYNSRRYDNRRYDRRRSDRRSYRNRRRCDKGTGGTIIGAIAGGLLGNEVAARGDKTVGAVIGAAVGAIGGRAIDKADDPCRRRFRR